MFSKSAELSQSKYPTSRLMSGDEIVSSNGQVLLSEHEQ